MHQGFLRSLLLLMLFAISGCNSGDSSRNAEGEFSGKLTLTGSSTIAPLISEIAKRFEELHPEVRIDVQTGGTGKGIADVRTGQADIGMASRLLNDDEQDLTVHQIAADGVSMIVHDSNPVDDLTPEQIRGIYTGQMQNWNELGGPDLPIIVVHKAEGRATLEVFLDHFKLKNPQIRADVIVGENEQGVKTVAGAPGAIGYVSIGTAEADVGNGVAIKLLPLGGVAATSENVASQTFPMSRPLNLVTGSSPSPLARAFIEYVQSKAVHDIVKDQYFVPISH